MIFDIFFCKYTSMDDFFEPCFYAISVFIKWILIIYKFDIFGNEAMDLEKIYRESLVLFFDIFPFLDASS